jgi:hypothetical protein
MSIPWCDDQVDFDNGERIVLEALDTIEQELRVTSSYAIRQSGHYVYVSLDDRFDSAQLVAGNSTINGDRSVELTSTGVYFY